MKTFTEYLMDKNYKHLQGKDIQIYEKKYIAQFPDYYAEQEAIKGESGPVYHRMLTDDEYRMLTKNQKQSYLQAAIDMELLRKKGLLGKNHIEGKILDYGCGSGGSSIFLSLQSSSVDAVDISEMEISRLRLTGLFEGNSFLGDGFDYMQKPNNYDLIVAYYLGFCNSSIDFVKKFITSAAHALKPEGRLFVMSDLLTMDTFRSLLGIKREGPSRESEIIEFN